MVESRTTVIDLDDVENVKNDEKTESVQNRISSDAIFSKFTSTVWNEGKEKAETLLNSYCNVDHLRPYFNVEPKEILHRLLSSFIPIKFTDVDYQIPSELYGPVMICFTLIALLLFEMKSTGLKVQEGTLMGTAMLTCFGYWMGISAVLWLLAYLGSTQLRPVQINTLMGYALTGHCVVVLLGTVIHIQQSNTFFFLIWLICGGMCSVRVVTVFWAKTPGRSERLIASVTILIFHMGFMLYLHFAYRLVVKEVVQVIKKI